MNTVNQAEKVLVKLNFQRTTLGCNSFDNEMDNNELHDLLNEECTGFQTLCDQDVWVFGDGSYITRNEDDYFFDDDVVQFEITHEEQVSN